MMLIEEYVLGGCRPANMVATAHNMSDGREERVARYKEERRRELEARYGPRISSQEQDVRQETKESRQYSLDNGRERTESIRERLGRNSTTTESTKSDTKNNDHKATANGDGVRSTRASRLRTQANQMAQGQISRIPQPLEHPRPRSGDYSSVESYNKEEDSGVSNRRKWKVTRSFTSDTSPASQSQQSSASSSPNNERKTKTKYVGTSRSLSPGGVPNVLGRSRSSIPSVAPTSSPLPRSSQLVRRANNTRVSPARRSETSPNSKQSSTPPSAQRERKSSASPARERLPSLLPVKQPANTPNRASETSKFVETPPKLNEASKFNDASKFDNDIASSPPFSPLKHPASILKKSSLDESSSQPVSILKRKSSRDEGGRCASPVKWSSDQVSGRPRATVVVPASVTANLNLPLSSTTSTAGSSSSAQSRGILKKHRSLDEPPPHALIVESANLYNGNEEMRPILKGQGRRCSLEELKRNQSPEGHPQGILKRKTSSGGCDEPVIHELSDIPHGILKRKGSSPIRSHPVSPVRESLFDDQRKTILKKKSSCEEPPDSPLLEPSHPPRPILKKKSIDEEECPAVRPILKTKNDDVNSLNHDIIKPILKHSEESSTTTVVYRSNSVRSTYQNRRSLDPNFVYMRPHSPSNERPSRPLSIAERILHLETSLDHEALAHTPGASPRMDENESDSNGCGLSRSSSVSERASMWNKLDQESRAAAQASAVRRVTKELGNLAMFHVGEYFRKIDKQDVRKKQEIVTRGRAARGDATSRFNTQPVTMGEVEQARRNNQQQELDCVDEDDEPSRLSLAERVRIFSSGGSSSEIKTPPKVQLPPTPRKNQQIAHSATSSIVSGLLKNIRDKATGGPPKDRTPVKMSRQSSGWDSSDDEGGSTDSSDTDSTPSISSSPPRQKINMVVGMVGGGGVVVRRCATEPMDHVRVASSNQASDPAARDSDESDGAPVVTIAERLAQLQRSGSTDWRKRVKPQDNGEPNGGVADRLGKLETAAQGWKSRVEVKDNIRFTVAGKMASVPSSPVTLLPPQVRSHPQPQIFSPQGIESMSTPVSPEMGDSILGVIKRSASAPGSDHLKRILNGIGGGETPGPIVTVPEVCDEEFHSFFPDYTPSMSSAELSPTSTEDIDFELLTSNSTKLLVSKRRVRAQRKHHSTNPLRALAQRSDLRTEYVEVRSGIAEKERIRLNLDKLSKTNPGLAVEALAGLASKEELTSVVLRRSADTGPVKQVAQWSHPLLLRTKGRRHPITCIVPPSYTSVNQGDAYILVTSNQVFCWIGEFCNVIEKSRATEVASEIQTRKDMGCLSASKVINLDGTFSSSHHDSFWNMLKLPHDKNNYKGEAAGHPEEDELFETALSQSYRIYELSNGSLVPVEHAWGRHPKIDFLQPNKVMVFDLVTEIFCWCGKGSSVSERKLGSKLANELAKAPAWAQCGITWLDSEIKSKPSRVYFVTQHMEPIIFREKFTDWPDFNRNNIGHKGENGYSSSESGKACDIKPMLDWNLSQPDLVLETSHLGRGNKFYDIETRRYYHVATQSVKIWRIEDYAPVEISEKNFGHFYDSHSYIIQWKYTLTVTGRELSGEPSKHQALGRDRMAYWTWHGRHAGLEGGAAALISVGMQQGAPQVTVKEGLEPPALQALMPTSTLVIHSESLSSTWPKMYIIEPGQDSSSTESSLVRQLPVEDCCLRSAASFLYIPRASSSTVYVWHGCSSKPYYRKVALEAAKQLMEEPTNFKLSSNSVEAVEIIEGNEPRDFFNGVVLRKSYSSEYYSKADNSNESEVKLKMFELTQVKGIYTAVPVPPFRFNPEAKKEETWRYVYSQEELYSTVSQCVLVDACPRGVWLWLRSTSPVPSAQALTTQLAYSVAKSIEPDQVWVVCQGTEPADFRSLFPWWSSELCHEAPEGWNEGELRQSTDEISKLPVKTYTIHDLTSSTLPAGVDPTRLELYLTEPQFYETFSMSQNEFESLPSWKQKKLKKSAALF